MTIEFKKRIETSKLLDPRNNFTEKSFPLEFRYDPLTKDMGLVIESRRVQLERADLSKVIARSLEIGCPFCPGFVEKVTPKFIPDICSEGRIKAGEAVIFPNMDPYMPYSAITVVGSKHFVGLPEFSVDMLTNAFLASQTYLKRIQEYDPRAKYCYIMWNYMPPANSSQIHPHLQVLAGRFPLAYHQVLLDASRKYRNENGTVFWSDLVAEERKLEERYIGTIGNTIWLSSFVPRCFRLDIQAIFQEGESFLSLPQEDIESFCQGLARVFNYMDDQNCYSFNLCLYSGMAEDSFWTQARIIERRLLPPLDISDIGHMYLADTRISIRHPEAICQELKPYFAPKGQNEER